MYYRPESELVEAVAYDVLRKLNRVSSSDIDREGLGLGGIGQITLADLVFDKHRFQFESFCFLGNVREESEKLGLINLHEELIVKLLKDESMNLGTTSLPPHVKDRLRRQKVLVVLDDVNNSKQSQVLVGDRDLFGHESRIILLKLKAFRGNTPTTDYIERLSEEVVEYAGGIPLAINILASHLRSLDSQSIGNWEMDFDNLKSIDLSHSIRLVQFPDFSHAPKLEKINLHSSLSLLQVPSVSLQDLDKLTDLNLSHCNKVQNLPITMITSLVSLDLSSTAIVSLPSSIDSLKNLSQLSLNKCTRLANLPKIFESLPAGFFKLRSLASLDLDGCSKLKNLPEVSEPMEHLEFSLSRIGIRQLPSSIAYLVAVAKLDMQDCYNLELYLSGSNIIEIPASIKRCSKLTRLYINNCKNLHSLPKLPLSLKCLNANGCVSLEVVSNKRPFTLEFWDGYCIKEGTDEHFSFSDCLKLDQNEQHNIMIDFHLRVLRMATQFLSPEPQERITVQACCPGNEIPKWFEYQCEGSFISIKLPPKWCTNNFLGFVVCVVGRSYSDIKDLDLDCEFDLKTNQGKNHNFIWTFNNYVADFVKLPTTSNSGHVYMWYNQYWDFYSECLHVEEVSLDFSFREWECSEDDDSIGIKSSKCEVKKCGIHMLYCQNLEEYFMNLQNQHRHDPDQPKPRAHRTNDFDADQPHPKRTKFTNS
ncbi:hypothetical protein TIFTF001_003973 [Ficus carica]|uniref:C-JID domain-containing protein n=1 Tax=Ficus carica TaxID=3494 RepID=A0AA88A2K7_FICCA|nr:hypothetical protein TIFTF001_003973 [Ficus carica]